MTKRKKAGTAKNWDHIHRLEKFATDSGMSATDLASAAGKTQSHMFRVIKGEKPLSLSLAVDLEIGLRQRRDAGLLVIEPLRAADFFPKLRSIDISPADVG